MEYLKQNNTNEKYVLDIIDHTSKFLKSYGLKTKTSHEILQCFRDYIYSVDKPSIFQFDNGTEFKNNEILAFLHNNIEVIFSSPFHPQTNGVVEVVHKQMQQIIFNKFSLNQNDFDLREAILDANYYHNNEIHSTTGYRPFDLKDCNDQKIIEEIKERCKKIFETKINIINNQILEIGDKLLLREHFNIKDNKLTISKKKGSTIHSIPCIFNGYCKNHMYVKIIIKCNFKDILTKNKLYMAQPALLLIVLDTAFDFYLNRYNDNNNDDSDDLLNGLNKLNVNE